ncbi:class B sortase [uncultured Ruthenibacterium sp.]|uniref:class B sortase n=1 Tax=uncultured Ruthenibacterium sp. TaxID=1905347 RepID=UPI00349E79D7
MQRSKRRKSHPILTILEIVLIGVFLFSAGKIGYALWQYHKGDVGYQAIREQVKPAQEHLVSNSGASESLQEQVDFAKLQQQYPDAVAWLHCDGTEIDYPVMQAADNDYYLRRLPNGEWNLGGSLFLDYRSSSDFSGELSLIYGHNMNDGSMFSDLENYTRQDWYDEHPVFTLETSQGVSNLQVLYGFIIPAQQWVDLEFDVPGNREQLIDYAASHTTFISQMQWDGVSPLVALLTCETTNDQNRYVLLCALQTA